jgi:hypothetical protein
LLNEPNTFSPANVDASVMYRKWRDTKEKDEEYVKIIRFAFYNLTFVLNKSLFQIYFIFTLVTVSTM